MFRKPKPLPDWYEAMISDVETFAASLPASVIRTFERRGEHFLLDVLPPTVSHRRLTLEGSLAEFDYALGRVWTERLEPSPEVCDRLLATLDAVRDGHVREVRDRRTDVIHHVYRLKTRGFTEFMRDAEYSPWRWFKFKIRRIQVHALPPLTEFP